MGGRRGDSHRDPAHRSRPRSHLSAQRAVVGAAVGRGRGRPVGPADPVQRLDGAGPRQPRRRRGPLDRAAVRGRTIAEVGDSLDGDLLGEDPRRCGVGGRWRPRRGRRDAARARHRAPVVRRGAGRRVRPPARRRPPRPRLGPRRRDRRATAPRPGARRRRWRLVRRHGGRLPRRRAGRTAGVPSGGDPQADLLARFGRDAAWGPAHAGSRPSPRRSARGRRRDHGADDRRLRVRGHRPAPDGVRHEGAADVRAVWERCSRETPAARPSRPRSRSWRGDRGVLRWRFEWVDDDGRPATCAASTCCACATAGCARSSPTSRADPAGTARRATANSSTPRAKRLGRSVWAGPVRGSERPAGAPSPSSGRAGPRRAPAPAAGHPGHPRAGSTGRRRRRAGSRGRRPASLGPPVTSPPVPAPRRRWDDGLGGRGLEVLGALDVEHARPRCWTAPSRPWC